MAKSRFIDVTGALTLAGRLADLTDEQLGQAGVDALNQTVDRTNDLARERMIAGLNLSDAYVRGKMVVTHATHALPRARITAEGTSTPLSQYATGLSVVQDRYTNSDIQALGKRFDIDKGYIRGKIVPWTKRKGLPNSGVPVDRKQAGRMVAVRRGSATLFPNTFIIPGRVDSLGNLLVFYRKSTGKLDTLLGPAVYQLFGYQINLLADDIGDDLAASIQSNIDAAIDAVFK